MTRVRFRIALLAGVWAGVWAAMLPLAARAEMAIQTPTVVVPALAGAAPGPAAGAGACEQSGAQAEQRSGVPEGLLRAIGRIESGRRDPATGAFAAWPWTINAEGRGHFYDSRDDALAATRALQGSGVASIDVGCFQVNLVHHPFAFATIEEGFDPIRNADYAARFLVALRGRTGSWEAAVAAYHSATPERGEPYRDRVLASWSGGSGMVAAGTAVAPVAAPAVIRAVTWSPAVIPMPSAARRGGAVPAAAPGAGMRVWTPSAPGQGASVIRITRG